MTKIFFIDDDPITLNMLSKAVEHAGYQVITSVNPWEAIAVAREHKPDIIILDLNMPELNGIEVLSMLRSDATTAHIPILVLSAGAELDASENVLSAGGQAYLHKPLSMKKLLEIVDQYSNSHH